MDFVQRHMGVCFIVPFLDSSNRPLKLVAEETCFTAAFRKVYSCSFTFLDAVQPLRNNDP